MPDQRSLRALGLTRDQTLLRALASALPSNATMRDLVVMGTANDDILALSPVFSALGTNTGLKTLTLDLNHSQSVTKAHISTIYIDIAAMLQDNASLERLSIRTRRATKAEDYIGLITALQHNTMLETFCLGGLHLNDDESKQMAALLKRNYALESLPGIDLKNGAGDVGAILRLNEAGRRYLIEDGSSISKGVEVLSVVSKDINCVFLHLLENPRLCDRSAVEIVSFGKSNSSSTSPAASNVGGKREPANVVHRGKESRRRLA
jgi:hypothetical protein